MGGLLDFLGITSSSESAARQRRLAEQRAQKDAATAKADFSTNLGRAAQTGTQSAEDYFRSIGLDPSLYSGDIARTIEQIRSGIPQGGTIGGAFSGVGQNVADQLTQALRSRGLASIGGLKAPTIDPTSDDAIIEKILSEQRAGAEDYATNLSKRGVVNESGYNAIEKDIGNQENTARGLLNQLGDTILGGGRTQLDDIISQGKLDASNLNLGQNFDTEKYSTNLQSTFDDFMKGLEGTFRTQAPAKLFDTAGLASIGGQAQGPQNLAFNQRAVLGTDEDPNKDEENRAATTVF